MDQVARVALERVESSGHHLPRRDRQDRRARIGPRPRCFARRRAARHSADRRRHDRQHQYGMVRTDHILFIAAGAFHVSKPSDLIPELQGRFPIRVELQSLTIDDFKRILTEPKNALVKQYKALMETEGITLEFTDDAIDEVANFAFRSTRPPKTSARAACTRSWRSCSTRFRSKALT